MNYDLHLARKYLRIFVCRHYLFRGAIIFLRATLKENSGPRETDIIWEYVISRLVEAIVFISFEQFTLF